MYMLGAFSIGGFKDYHLKEGSLTIWRSYMINLNESAKVCGIHIKVTKMNSSFGAVT